MQGCVSEYNKGEYIVCFRDRLNWQRARLTCSALISRNEALKSRFCSSWRWPTGSDTWCHSL